MTVDRIDVKNLSRVLIYAFYFCSENGDFKKFLLRECDGHSENVMIIHR